VAQLGVDDCSTEARQERRAPRLVLQFIENSFYQWNEYDLPSGAGRRRFGVEMVRPRRGLLSAYESQVLLSASQLWTDARPVPGAAVVLDPSDPRLSAPPIESVVSSEGDTGPPCSDRLKGRSFCRHAVRNGLITAMKGAVG
jgi:hypothetical protein